MIKQGGTQGGKNVPVSTRELVHDYMELYISFNTPVILTTGVHPTVIHFLMCQLSRKHISHSIIIESI
jgi:hypothetical protein